MKSIFKNFSWSKMIAYTIVFGAISTTFDLFMGKYKQPGLNITKTIAINLAQFLVFGFVMSLFLGNKVIKKQSENK